MRSLHLYCAQVLVALLVASPTSASSVVWHWAEPGTTCKPDDDASTPELDWEPVWAEPCLDSRSLRVGDPVLAVTHKMWLRKGDPPADGDLWGSLTWSCHDETPSLHVYQAYNEVCSPATEVAVLTVVGEKCGGGGTAEVSIKIGNYSTSAWVEEGLAEYVEALERIRVECTGCDFVFLNNNSPPYTVLVGGILLFLHFCLFTNIFLKSHLDRMIRDRHRYFPAFFTAPDVTPVNSDVKPGCTVWLTGTGDPSAYSTPAPAVTSKEPPLGVTGRTDVGATARRRSAYSVHKATGSIAHGMYELVAALQGKPEGTPSDSGDLGTEPLLMSPDISPRVPSVIPENGSTAIPRRAARRPSAVITSSPYQPPPLVSPQTPSSAASPASPAHAYPLSTTTVDTPGANGRRPSRTSPLTRPVAPRPKPRFASLTGTDLSASFASPLPAGAAGSPPPQYKNTAGSRRSSLPAVLSSESFDDQQSEMNCVALDYVEHSAAFPTVSAASPRQAAAAGSPPPQYKNTAGNRRPSLPASESFDDQQSEMNCVALDYVEHSAAYPTVSAESPRRAAAAAIDRFVDGMPSAQTARNGCDDQSSLGCTSLAVDSATSGAQLSSVNEAVKWTEAQFLPSNGGSAISMSKLLSVSSSKVARSAASSAQLSSNEPSVPAGVRWSHPATDESTVSTGVLLPLRLNADAVDSAQFLVTEPSEASEANGVQWPLSLSSKSDFVDVARWPAAGGKSSRARHPSLRAGATPASLSPISTSCVAVTSPSLVTTDDNFPTSSIELVVPSASLSQTSTGCVAVVPSASLSPTSTGCVAVVPPSLATTDEQLSELVVPSAVQSPVSTNTVAVVSPAFAVTDAQFPIPTSMLAAPSTARSPASSNGAPVGERVGPPTIGSSCTAACGEQESPTPTNELVVPPPFAPPPPTPQQQQQQQQHARGGDGRRHKPCRSSAARSSTHPGGPPSSAGSGSGRFAPLRRRRRASLVGAGGGTDRYRDRERDREREGGLLQALLRPLPGGGFAPISPADGLLPVCSADRPAAGTRANGDGEAARVVRAVRCAGEAAAALLQNLDVRGGRAGLSAADGGAGVHDDGDLLSDAGSASSQNPVQDEYIEHAATDWTHADADRESLRSGAADATQLVSPGTRQTDDPSTSRSRSEERSDGAQGPASQGFRLPPAVATVDDSDDFVDIIASSPASVYSYMPGSPVIGSRLASKAPASLHGAGARRTSVASSAGLSGRNPLSASKLVHNGGRRPSAPAFGTPSEFGTHGMTANSFARTHNTLSHTGVSQASHYSRFAPRRDRDSQAVSIDNAADADDQPAAELFAPAAGWGGHAGAGFRAGKTGARPPPGEGLARYGAADDGFRAVRYCVVCNAVETDDRRMQLRDAGWKCAGSGKQTCIGKAPNPRLTLPVPIGRDWGDLHVQLLAVEGHFGAHGTVCRVRGSTEEGPGGRRMRQGLVRFERPTVWVAKNFAESLCNERRKLMPVLPDNPQAASVYVSPDKEGFWRDFAVEFEFDVKAREASGMWVALIVYADVFVWLPFDAFQKVGDFHGRFIRVGEIEEVRNAAFTSWQEWWRDFALCVGKVTDIRQHRHRYHVTVDFGGEAHITLPAETLRHATEKEYQKEFLLVPQPVVVRTMTAVFIVHPLLLAFKALYLCGYFGWSIYNTLSGPTAVYASNWRLYEEVYFRLFNSGYPTLMADFGAVFTYRMYRQDTGLMLVLHSLGRGVLAALWLAVAISVPGTLTHVIPMLVIYCWMWLPFIALVAGLIRLAHRYQPTPPHVPKELRFDAAHYVEHHRWFLVKSAAFHMFYRFCTELLAVICLQTNYNYAVLTYEGFAYFETISREYALRSIPCILEEAAKLVSIVI
ncbi:hypothetical protein DIPPA_22244 [Diplonema papillatum]|nr:hypothetical protein DIPPA_22244 [Diplonema papillatum]